VTPRTARMWIVTSTASALRLPRALVFATLCIAVTGGGHVLAGGWAAGLTALWLARGESALWTLLRRLSGRLRHLLVIQPGARAAPGDERRPPEHARAVPRAALLRYAVSRRGPPSGAFHTG
jgi:hypothetical protein